MNQRTVLIFALAFTLAVTAAFAVDIPNPFKNAKEGDWVVHEMKGGMQMKQTVIKL